MLIRERNLLTPLNNDSKDGISSLCEKDEIMRLGIDRALNLIGLSTDESDLRIGRFR